MSTERRAVGDSDTLLGLVVDWVDDTAVFTLNADGEVSGWNAGAERMFGYASEEIVGRHASCLYPEEELARGAPHRDLGRAADEGAFHGDGIRLRKDGSRFRANAVFQAQRGTRGELRGFAALVRDRRDRTSLAGAAANVAGPAMRVAAPPTSQQILEGIIDSIPVRVFWKDKDHVFLGCNMSFARDAGFASPSDIIGKDDHAMVWHAQADLYRNDDRQVIESGTAKLLLEEPQTTPDGNTITLLTSKIPLRNAEGEISGVIGTYMDITERTRVEEALRRSQALLNATGRRAKMGGWELSVRSQRLTWTDELYRIHEVPPDFEPTVALAIDFYAPESRPIITEAVRRAVAHAEPFDLQLQIVTAKGNRRSVQAVGEAQTKDGEVVTVAGTFQDITERKQAEEALRASEDKFRGIFSGVSDGIVLTDLATEKIFLGNPAMCRMLGYSAPELVELDAGALLTEEASALERTRPLPRDVARFTADVPVKRKDGSVFYADVTALVVVIGGMEYALSCYRDVSERKELQARLAQSDRLATMGTLAAGVAHEINNPLSYVLYSIQSLAEDVPKLLEALRRCHGALRSHLVPDLVRDLLGPEAELLSATSLADVATRFQDALSGSLRIKDIARGLGTFSRVERNEVLPVDVHESVEHAITLAQNEIKYRARLVKDFGRVPMVLASDGKLAQVFLNLFINAAHAIPEGHVERNEIRVRTWAEGEHVYAEVSDTGQGVLPEHRAKIFEPFFTTKGIGAGTGLGLSICKTIITGFGGELTFTSAVGAGSRFSIRLPRLSADWERRHEEGPQQASIRPAIRGRILVVDDEAGIRRSIVRFLGREHEVVAAASGEEAQALLRADRRFDLVFCDLMMPRMSGMDLHAWLVREDAALAEQIVFITGGAFTPGATEYLARVGNLRVEKPFDPSAFKRLTDELVLAARAKLPG